MEGSWEGGLGGRGIAFKNEHQAAWNKARLGGSLARSGLLIIQKKLSNGREIKGECDWRIIKSAVVRVRPWGPSARMALSRRLIDFRFPSFSFPVEAPLSLILERGLQARRCEHLTPLWTRVKGETPKVNRYLCSFALGSTIWNFRIVGLDPIGSM